MGGLATAIRLAANGYKVTVFEKNNYAGGKLSELRLNNYRFDKGPSLLTLPHLIDELTHVSNYPNPFVYSRLQTLTHYFYEDGTCLKAPANAQAFAEVLNKTLHEEVQTVTKHLQLSALYYNLTADIFLHNSLHRFKTILTFRTFKGLVNSWRLPLLSTMHQANSKRFKNEKTVQLFNRYATYNGSSPYKAPALLNIIPHLEFNLGAYLPEQGMHAITQHLVACAQHLGVTFKYNETVSNIHQHNQKASGIKSNGVDYDADLVVSDVDMHVLYKHLLPPTYYPKRLLNQEKSSSAYIFYWGIKASFSQLDVHNILFSNDYQAEFKALFETQEPYSDPTIYINITSKICKADAPSDCENWFVMVNVPHNATQAPISYGDKLRSWVIKKINRILNTTIEPLIEVEAVLDPFGIELQTSSFGGSLYGNSSNSTFSAFLRHANYSSKLKGLYLVGGSVHPGGGIPLSLLSGKIVSALVKDDTR